MTSIDLEALERKAEVWLIEQPINTALPPDVAANYKKRFYLPSVLVEGIRRDEGKKAR